MECTGKSSRGCITSYVRSIFDWIGIGHNDIEDIRFHISSYDSMTAGLHPCWLVPEGLVLGPAWSLRDRCLAWIGLVPRGWCPLVSNLCLDAYSEGSAPGSGLGWCTCRKPHRGLARDWMVPAGLVPGSCLPGAWLGLVPAGDGPWPVSA